MHMLMANCTASAFLGLQLLRRIRHDCGFAIRPGFKQPQNNREQNHEGIEDAHHLDAGQPEGAATVKIAEATINPSAVGKSMEKTIHL